eukprot:945876-Rhodomonas_salina.2
MRMERQKPAPSFNTSSSNCDGEPSNPSTSFPFACTSRTFRVQAAVVRVRGSVSVTLRTFQRASCFPQPPHRRIWLGTPGYLRGHGGVAWRLREAEQCSLP